VSSGLQEARRLIQHRGAHRVISLYLDLDPERFATPPARASQVRSLLDDGHRIVDGLDGLGHADKVALREDLKRIDTFLSSPDAPFKGARSLAVFCSSLDDLFEMVQLARQVPGRIVIEPAPYVEPMIAALENRQWLVALVNRRTARLLSGSPERLRERERRDDRVRGQSEVGGWSQANYERSAEEDALHHLRGVAEDVNRRWRAERFDRIVLGGPQEAVARFEEMLADEVRSRLVPEKVDVDITSATEAQVRTAVEEIVTEDERRGEAEALTRLSDAVGAGRRGVVGLQDTLAALNERRVQTLLLSPSFDAAGRRCPSCGMLVAEDTKRCPADGTGTDEVDHVREAVVEAAVTQDAEVMVLRHHDDQPPHGIAAILRF
jgi:peptide chain release factor subunit 1